MKESLSAETLSLHCLPVLHTCCNFDDFNASICCMFFANIFRELRKLNISEKCRKNQFRDTILKSSLWLNLLIFLPFALEGFKD